jgi:ElaB/YqjD/DUF883 family membrane-anchored ribosome-binding protein
VRSNGKVAFGGKLLAPRLLANQAVDGVSKSFRSAGQQVRDGAYLASDKTVAYIRDEPVKSMLIAAATGAALAVLARLAARPNKEH